ncbi:MAG: hypothetical protein WC501_02490 [Candidatus Micrarchaeia archaeon]
MTDYKQKQPIITKNATADMTKTEISASTNPKRLAQMLESLKQDERMAGLKNLGTNVDALLYVFNKSYYNDVKEGVVKQLESMINNLTNVNALICVALNSKDLEIGKRAVEKLSGNENALRDILKQPWKTEGDPIKIESIHRLIEMTDKLTSPESLEYIIMAHFTDSKTTKMAIERLFILANNEKKKNDVLSESEKILCKLANKCKFIQIRNKIVEFFSENVPALEDIITTVPVNQDIALLVVEKLSRDKEVLERIARNRDARIPIQAMIQIFKVLSGDTNAIEYVAIGPSRLDVTRKAIEMLNDEPALLRVSKHSQEHKMLVVEKLKTMVDQLTNPELLNLLYQNEITELIAGKIIAKLASMVNELTNDISLLYVAKYSEDATARKIAVEKISENLKGGQSENITRMLDIAEKSKYADTRMDATKIIAEFNNRHLCIIAVRSNYKDSAMLAVEMIPNEFIGDLTYVAIESKHSEVRAAAVEKLSGNEEALNKIANECKYEDTKEMAKSKATSKDSEFVTGLTDILLKTDA